MKLIPALAAALLLAGCATQTTRQSRQLELAPEPGFEIVLSAAVGEGVEQLELPPGFRPGAADANAPLLTVEVRLLTLTNADAARLLGDHGHVAAHSMTPARADEFARTAGELPGTRTRGAPRLTMHEGQTGGITIMDEREYVSGYTINVRENDRYAEAVTSKYLDGVRLDISGRHVQGRLHLELDLLLVEVARMDETSVELLGESIKLQTPVKVAQHIRAKGSVAPGRVLVLSGKGAGGVIVALVSTR
jgi:hypothetical protein